LKLLLQELKHAQFWVRRGSMEKGGDDCIAAMVQARLQEEADRGMRASLLYFISFFCVSTIVSLVNIYLNRPRWMSPVQDAILLFGICAIVAMHWFPSLVRPRVFYVVQQTGLFLFGVSAHAFSEFGHHGHYCSMTLVVTLRMAFSLSYVDQLATVFIIPATFLCSCIAYPLIGLPRYGMFFLMLEAGIGIFVIFFTHHLWKFRASAVRQEIE